MNVSVDVYVYIFEYLLNIPYIQVYMWSMNTLIVYRIYYLNSEEEAKY